MKLALLSNVNVDYIAQSLKTEYEMAPSVGYGDIFGQLLNDNSQVNEFAPDVVAIVVDLRTLLSGATSVQECVDIVDDWKMIFASVRQEDRIYLISDAVYRDIYVLDNDDMDDVGIEALWGQCVSDIVSAYTNVHRFKLSDVAKTMGYEDFFSDKMWYMGSIPYSKTGMEKIAEKINITLKAITTTSKKVLVLDMDNTLWSGVIGEDGIDKIKLAESKIGAIYRDAQRLIKSMASKGVMLAICSKNNESDVNQVWQHPHMVLKQEDFVALKINWNDKAQNIKEIAQELNVGLDSMVFIDDMPFEREAVRTQLPEVTVPEYPEKKEDIPKFYKAIYEQYFMKAHTTKEDLNKTSQYKDNAKRARFAEGLSFEDYLKGLELKAGRVEINEASIDRIVQLIGKTNQFNLTTKRYDLISYKKCLETGYIPYAYNVSDKFGDYGLVAVALVKPKEDVKTAVIDTFLMSCRVMGKKVEDYILDDIESDLEQIGFETVEAIYVKTAKNAPVQSFYDEHGYTVKETDGENKAYSLELKQRPQRQYFVN